MRKVLFILLASITFVNICEAQTGVHEWSEYDKKKIRSLWIENLPVSPGDKTNRVATNPDAATLGHRIFFDTRFSVNNKVACASCHQPDKYFTDGLETAQGIGKVKRNAPTIVGISYSPWFFLDGRADSLWSQALGPLEHELEHGGNRNYYAHLIFNDPAYRKAYEGLFGKMPDLSDAKRFPRHAGPVYDRYAKAAWDSMSEQDRSAITAVFVNIGKALAAYETKLKPAPARFDKYVKAVVNNDTSRMQATMNHDEVAGLRLFINKANCIICHNGPLFSDFGFHNTAIPPVNTKRYDWGRFEGVHKVIKSEFNCRGAYNDATTKQCDELEYIIVDREHTIGLFRTPMLRNASKTAPYMHGGQYKSLSDVMKHYNNPPSTKLGMSDLVAIPIDLTNKELAQLEAFIKALDSEVNADQRWLNAPE